MDYVTDTGRRTDEIAALFETTFTASEGAEEGRVVGALARRLIETTPSDDLRVFCAVDGPRLAGAILFTRLRYPDPRAVFLLAPVAVAPNYQGQRTGQALIRHGLDRIRAGGGEIAVTYGDPAFYARTGFRPVGTDTVPAPFPLGLPHGWQAQALTDAPLTPLAGPATCVPAFADPALW